MEGRGPAHGSKKPGRCMSACAGPRPEREGPLPSAASAPGDRVASRGLQGHTPGARRTLTWLPLVCAHHPEEVRPLWWGDHRPRTSEPGARK